MADLVAVCNAIVENAPEKWNCAFEKAAWFRLTPCYVSGLMTSIAHPEPAFTVHVLEWLAEDFPAFNWECPGDGMFYAKWSDGEKVNDLCQSDNLHYIALHGLLWYALSLKEKKARG